MLHSLSRVPLLVLLLFIAVQLIGVVSRVNDTANARLLADVSLAIEADGCPRCDMMFSKLETTADGKRVQNVSIQERGEPKSGTTFMFQWARGALDRTCELLKSLYGEKTCRLEHEGPLGFYLDPRELTFTFEPGLGDDDAPCSCTNVDMVKIMMNKVEKHMLPVGNSCLWAHGSNLAIQGRGCNAVGGRPVENHADIWSCMNAANCDITDDRLQFVVLRDPRAVAVSTYFHMKVHPTKQSGNNPVFNANLDDGVMMLLPETCKWLAIRHILFEGLMPDQSAVFWYQDAEENPLRWHYRWTTLAGLQLPSCLMEEMATAAASGAFNFKVAGKNEHPGGEKEMTNRTWRDEVSPELLADMDAVLNRWLPTTYLARLGVAS